MITYSWRIAGLDTYPIWEQYENVVFTIHWCLLGQDEDGHLGQVYGAIGVQPVAGQEFVPYEQLTTEIVIGWVDSALGEEAIGIHRAAVDSQIVAQIVAQAALTEV